MSCPLRRSQRRKQQFRLPKRMVKMSARLVFLLKGLHSYTVRGMLRKRRTTRCAITNSCAAPSMSTWESSMTRISRRLHSSGLLSSTHNPLSGLTVLPSSLSKISWRLCSSAAILLLPNRNTRIMSTATSLSGQVESMSTKSTPIVPRFGRQLSSTSLRWA